MTIAANQSAAFAAIFPSQACHPATWPAAATICSKYFEKNAKAAPTAAKIDGI